MSVLCSSGTVADPGDAFAPRANGLALALIDSIPGGTFRDTSVSTDSLSGYVIDHGETSATVVLTDFRDPRSAGARSTTVDLPFPVAGAVQAQLRGPRWNARYPQDSLFPDRSSASPGGTPAVENTEATGSTAATGNASPAGYPADPRVALSVENALRPVGDGSVSVDGYGLPITPVAQRPAVAGIEPGSTSFTVPIPAGSTTVLTLKKTTATPTAQESP